MKKVCILTTFDSADPSYSLNLVAQDQIKMLLAGDYTPVVIVSEKFDPVEAYALPGVIVEKVSSVTASNEGTLPENWKSEVDMLASQYKRILGEHEIDVIITHDIISQPAALVPNLAARKAAEDFPKTRWLHWVHSVFSSNCPSNVIEASEIGRSKWPNSKIVFPNAYDRPRVARSFNVEESDVFHCPHPTDIEGFLGVHPVLRRLFKEKNTLDKEVIMVYPCRLDRGKQPHFNVEVAAALKKLGSTVQFICVDFSSTGGDKVTYREEMKNLAVTRGLDDTDVIFLSEFDEEFRLFAPREVVRQLFSISNIFLLPSVSETYSLVTQEASLLGNFIILNQDFYPMRSIFGENPKYFQFSGNIGIDGLDGNVKTEYNQGIEAYAHDIACYIRFQLEHNRVLNQKTWIRQNRSLRAVLKKYLEPLLHGDRV